MECEFLTVMDAQQAREWLRGMIFEAESAALILDRWLENSWPTYPNLPTVPLMEQDMSVFEDNMYTLSHMAHIHGMISNWCTLH